MKLIYFIVFLQVGLGALIPRSDISQLTLMKNLYDHFEAFHTASDQSKGLRSFFQFLAEHYGTNNHEHTDNDAHDNLPLKHLGGVVYLLFHQTNNIVRYDFQEIDRCMAYFPLYHLDFPRSIDHPPSV
ncbi:MAG TPA: hypothetical protein ACFCUD_12135 [Cyclobacteriaceae bacterium]